MSFVTLVSGRYLRTRQKRAFISLITVLSIAGVTLGVMALIVVIAVMAGFENDLKSRIMGIRPHLVLTKKQGAFTDYNQILARIEPIGGIETASAYITSQVVLRTTTRAAGAVLKGIEAGQGKHGSESLDTSQLAARSLLERASGGNSQPPGIILGKELAANLGMVRGDTLYMISPRGMLSPAGHIPAMIKFQVAGLFESGMYEFDGTLAFVDLKQAQKILRMPVSVSGIEIRLEDMDQVKEISNRIERVVDGDYAIENWKQINRNLFSALRLEKTVMFIILALIVLVAAFNIAGSLVMMVLEKRKDIAILKAMGATAKSIGRIFVIKGLIIGLVGTVMGTSAGLVLCILLKRYSFVHLPSDIYYINTLPVNLKPSDVLLIALCAMIICLAATLYPARQAADIDPAEAIRHA
jgi:lipoprotein-releasing system permease protein